jgi:energy-coupling factor transport system substrate-specific component
MVVPADAEELNAMTATRLPPLVSDLHRLGRALARAIAFAALLLAPAAAADGSVQAQAPEDARAGIVIDFGDGAVHTACVDLGADGQATGEEVLTAAGFDVLIEYSAQGGAVCKIGAQGCNFPDQSCWCECISSPCVYWAYNHLQDGQWLYSTLGASSYMVHAGDVDGWAWGAGTIAQGAQPPVVTFDQICVPPTATPAPTPTTTPTTAATAWVPWPTSTPTPTDAATPTPTWTPLPTAAATAAPTIAPTQTPTAIPAVTLQPTAPPTPGVTATPSTAPTSNSPAPVLASTATPTPQAVAAAELPPASPAGAAGGRAVYLPFMQRGAESVVLPDAPEAGMPAEVTAVRVETGVVTTTLASTATAAVAAPPPPPAVSSPSGATAHLAREDATSLSSRADAGWLQNAPFAAGQEAASITRGEFDPVLPLLLTLALAGALAALRVARRSGLRQAMAAMTPAALGRAAPAAGLRRLRAGQRGTDNTAGRSAFLSRHSSLLSPMVYSLTAGIGLVALLQPFLTAAAGTPSTGANATNAPLLVTILMALCFLALLFEVQGQAVSAKRIALLGVLVAINAVLRFVEVSIPGPGGFTPVFFLIVLTGYVFGGRFGFMMGALTLLVSSLITGGVGPWLPGQMFTAGWMGLLAPLARPLVRLAGGRPNSKAEVVVLAGYAGLCGLFYGVVINLWFWPFMTGPADQYWAAGITLGETVRRYAVYYVATSLVWDVFAVAGNIALVALFGAATLRALRRFHQRFEFAVLSPDVASDPVAVDESLERPETGSLIGAGRPSRALPAISLSEGRGRA